MQSININLRMFLSEGTAEAWQRECRNEHCRSGPTRVLGQMLETKFPPAGNCLVLGAAWDTGGQGTSSAGQRDKERGDLEF